MQRNTKQHEAVRSVLCSMLTHPTAEQVYDKVKLILPGIGISTVYRNLSDLAKDGKAITVKDMNGVVHYDSTVIPHNHFCCKICSKVFDINIKVTVDLFSQSDYDIDDYSIIFRGVCNSCKRVKA